MHDVIIIGGGPAGMASAVTLAAEGRKVLLLEAQAQLGGQIGTTTAVETFLTQLNITGADFANNSCQQCLKFGVEVKYEAPVRAIYSSTGIYHVVTGGKDMTSYYTHAIILAVGLTPKRLGVPGEHIHGIYHGMKMDVVPCPLEEAHIALVGGGNNVGQAAFYYLQKGSGVTIIARRPLAETMDAFLLDRIRGKAAIIYGDVEGFGVDEYGDLIVQLREDWGESEVRGVGCVHVMIGQEPHTEWLGKLVKRDAEGFIYTDKQHRTSAAGIFAIGDVRHGVVHRALAAAGSGVEVVPVVHEYLNRREQPKFQRIKYPHQF